jgi:hypothetical protein
MTTSFNLAHVYILLSNTTIFLVHLNHQSMCGHNHTPHPPSYFLINEPQYVTLPYKYKCFTFSRGFPYQYITTSYNLCRICLCICIQKVQIDTLVLHSRIPIRVMKGAPHGVIAQLRINNNWVNTSITLLSSLASCRRIEYRERIIILLFYDSPFTKSTQVCTMEFLTNIYSLSKKIKLNCSLFQLKKTLI